MQNGTAAPFLAAETFGAPTTDSTGNGAEQQQSGTSMETFSTVVLPIIYSIVCIVGLIGNGLVIYIMHLKVRTRNITDLYVLNLAIADFIFVAMLPFWTASIALGEWPFGPVMCKLTSGLTYFHMYASVFFLTAMSVDRFIAVVMYQTCRRTKMCASAAVITTWLVSAILGILPLYFRGVVVDPYTKSETCEWMFDNEIESHTTWFMVYIVTRSIVGFAIPLLIILVCYSLIIIFLKTRETRGKLTGKAQDRATKMVLVVIAVFLVCWVPNQVSNLVYVAKSLNIMPQSEQPDWVHYHVHMFSTCLAWMHSCANPILYAFMREDLRLKMTEIVNHNIKRCCGDNSWVDRQSGSIKSVDDQGRTKSFKSGRSEYTDSYRNNKSEETQVFRLSSHKYSVGESSNHENSMTREQSSLKHTDVVCREGEEDNLIDDADDVFLPATAEEQKLCDETTQQCIALMDHNSVKVEVQDVNENCML